MTGGFLSAYDESVQALRRARQNEQNLGAGEVPQFGKIILHAFELAQVEITPEFREFIESGDDQVLLEYWYDKFGPSRFTGGSSTSECALKVRRDAECLA